MTSLNEKLMLESEFYNRPFWFSYSSLNRLLYAPSIFYNEYVLGNKQQRTDAHLIDGKLIHYLVLDSAQFGDKFILASGDLPTAGVKDVVDIVYEVIDKNEDKEFSSYNNIIQTVLKQINLYQKFVDDKKPDKDGIQKTADEKRFEKIVTDQASKYFEFLKVKGNKDIIDQDTLDRCTRAADAIKSNQTVVTLLGLDRTHDNEAFGIYNELEINGDLEGMPFGIKGIIDNMVVDVESKLIIINDLKTSHKSLSDFPESIEYWNYWMQAAMYKKLAKLFLKDVIDNTWRIEFNFIVIDKYNQVYPFKVSNATMSMWTTRLDEQLVEANYHYTNRDYTLPYKFVAGEVLL
jgi:hypothetical protein